MCWRTLLWPAANTARKLKMSSIYDEKKNIRSEKKTQLVATKKYLDRQGEIERRPHPCYVIIWVMSKSFEPSRKLNVSPPYFLFCLKKKIDYLMKA